MEKGVPFVVVLAALSLGGCAADHDDLHESFDPRRYEIPPPPPAETGPLPRTDYGPRLAQGLTLDEAQKIALEANPGLSSNAEGVNAARARITEARNFTNPVFSFGKGEIPLKSESLTSDSTGSVKAWDIRTSNTFFALSKDLDVSGKRVARVDNAIENERQSEAQYASAALALRAQVRVAYASVLVAERNLELARESREMAKRNLDIISARAGGDALLADKLRAEADSARSENDQAQVERDLARAQRALATLLGAPEASLGPLRGELPLSTLPESVDERALSREALEKNADVIAARRSVLGAEANLRLQERTTVPDLTVSVQYNRYILDKLDTLGVQLGVPLPIFDQNRGQIAEATALLHQAERAETATEQAVIQGVADDAATLRVSRARIESFEKAILPRDREAVKLTEASYEGGKILYLDVITARQAFNQARADYVNELLNHETTLADLERLLARTIGGP